MLSSTYGSNHNILILNAYAKVVGRPGKERALDGGAGIGRITQGFLMKNFEVVDLVEQDPVFIAEAKRLLEPTNHKGQFFNTGSRFRFNFYS